MSNYANNKKIQDIDLLKLVEIEVFIYDKIDQGHEIQIIMKWDS